MLRGPPSTKGVNLNHRLNYCLGLVINIMMLFKDFSSTKQKYLEHDETIGPQLKKSLDIKRAIKKTSGIFKIVKKGHRLITASFVS